jgi:hypothetical protein
MTPAQRAQCIAIAHQRGDADEVDRLTGRPATEKTEAVPPAATSRYLDWPNAAGPADPQPEAAP